MIMRKSVIGEAGLGVHACSCLYDLTIDVLLTQSHSVFIGRLLTSVASWRSMHTARPSLAYAASSFYNLAHGGDHLCPSPPGEQMGPSFPLRTRKKNSFTSLSHLQLPIRHLTPHAMQRDCNSPSASTASYLNQHSTRKCIREL